MGESQLYHIGFSKQDLGEQVQAVLLCGDPQRARRIAQETDGVDCLQVLSENRGLNSYLCRLPDGTRFISATSGMGAPSLSIVVNELVQVGLHQIIRVGTCGGIADQVKVGSLVISQAALCRQGAAADIAPRDYPAAADPFLTVALVEAAQRLGLDYHLGVTASVDTFYEGQERTDSANPQLLRSLQGVTEEYRQLKILNYEMEAATLFKMGLVYGFSAACVCAVLAERCSSEKVNVEMKKQAEEGAVRVALNALKK
ncbi:uridine phosphorylase [Malonomonas rubra DSM 5091]|uniref:Uridine phosphorylase n=1 Tax=Malonomonas rubra DSM 5091 TaxID=1122189 RepID=A0A1M6K1R7_MALRU|nr:nucleoside phosphorylase [Malonomonas rubra]SHJ52867.1 uridine phosphorylase [Malonomonas rubra DSM 5091]